MKDKRNCQGNGFPMYQQPMMVPPYGIPMGYPSSMEQQMNSLEQKLNSLDQRVSRLESMSSTTNNYTKYNDSNYYMV